MKRLLIGLIWLPAAAFTIVAAFLTYQQTIKAQAIVFRADANYQRQFFSIPRVLGSFNASVEGVDAVPEVVAKYTQGTPLEPYTEQMIAIAERYDPKTEYPLIYWYLAIAKVESGLCRVIPHNSHNCTGWGIHSAGTLRYPTYEAAIEAWCKGFSSKYLAHPRWPKTTPDEVVKIHTPHSPIDQATGRQVWAVKIERELQKLLNNDL